MRRTPEICTFLLTAALVFACGEAPPEVARASSAATGDVGVSSEQVEAPPHTGSFAAGFSGIFDPYENARRALAGDRDAEVAAHAEEMASAARVLIADLTAEAAGVDERAVVVIAELLPRLEARAEALGTMDDVEEMRVAFGEISESLMAYRAELTGARPGVAYCPMVEKRWLQSGEEIENPYAGSEMAACGEIEAR